MTPKRDLKSSSSRVSQLLKMYKIYLHVHAKSEYDHTHMLHVATHTNIYNWQLKGTEKLNQMDFELN